MKTIVITFLLFAEGMAFGQTASNCNAILQHGLRNVNVSMSSEASIARKYENHCDKNYSLLTDEQVASIEVEVFGYGGGGGSYSRKEREERLSEWCKTNEEEALSNKESLTQSSVIYGRAYEAYEKCIELQDDKIQFDYQPSEDFKTININMQYTDNTTGDGLFFTGVVAEGFTYEIKTIDKEDNTVNKYSEFPDNTLFINNLATNILFKRDSSVVVKEGNQSYNKVPRGSITIQTSGKSLMLFYPEEYNPTIPTQKANELQSQIENLNKQLSDLGIDGIGSIVASLLSESKFKELYNKNGQEWILAKGQTISTNSKYFEHTNSNELPDLRGRFLRGKNHTRTKSKGNQDGDLDLGTEQDDAVGKHSHNYEAAVAVAKNRDSENGGNLQGGNNNKWTFSTLSEGNGIHSESRPRNVTVNYFRHSPLKCVS